jgi:excisionase family DNA binding protein
MATSPVAPACPIRLVCFRLAAKGSTEARLLDNLKRGEAVTVLPHDALLTTQQAAQILNVSRPYLYRLIEEHAVPVVMVGSHRRLRIHDVLQLREQRRLVRRSALDELSHLGQELQGEAL